MEELPHVLLVGAGAERFAREMGFPETDLLTPEAKAIWREIFDAKVPSVYEERLGYMLADSGAMVVLSQEGVLDSLPGFWGFVLRLDADWAMIAAEDDGPVPGRPQLDHLADVLYTSGSTGQAKGVMVTHRGLANLCAATAPMLGLAPGDRVLQLASLSFDVATWEIAMALSAGAALCLASRRESLPGPDLLRSLRELRITVLVLVASTLAALPHAELPDLRTVVVGGEACPPDLALRWGRGRRLVNSYGPTETTVCATAGELEAGGRLPLGRPIAGAGLHVLDATLRPVPVGVAGELCISGQGLARGYSNRPELTAERFLPHPWSAAPGERIYRTGDAARHLPDGRLEFIGRIDHQVKIRGFRIEPGEIEAALASLPEVGEAAVLVREDPLAGRSLMAAVAPAAPAATLTAAALRERLRTRLPGYMVPAGFVFVDTLPRLSNGKVDRTALALLAPAPGPAEDAAGAGTPPRTPVEERLAALYAEVLQVERLGVETSFFEVGGHSLLATRLVSLLREAFGVELPVSAVFDEPTVRGLAGTVEQALHGAAPAPAPAPPLEKVSRDAPLPLSFGQERLWLLDQMEPGGVTYNVPSPVRLEGRLDLPVLAASLDEIVRRHEALRTSFPVGRGGVFQAIAPQLRVALPVIDLRAVPEAARAGTARALASAEARRPFDLAAGPLLRLLLLRLAGDVHEVVLTLHHIVADAWSIGVFVRELAALYAAFLAGRPSPLPELPIQYADFAVWQRQMLQGDRLAAEAGWWRERLAGAPPVLALPADRPRPAVQRFRGRSQQGRIPARGLEALGNESGATAFMILLAALDTLLARYSGQLDLVVGSPIAGRTRVETEPLIGLFLNTLALRADLAGEPSFRELVRRVRETTLAAYAHQDLPFEKLVDDLSPERDLSHTPIFQVLFVLQNAPFEALELPALRLSPAVADTATSQFDLVLSATEIDGAVSCLWTYSTDLFDATRISRLRGHFAALLAAALEDPGRRLSDLPLLGEAERFQALCEWNDTRVERPAGTCLHELLAAQAERTPAAVALTFEGEELTYRDLDRRAGRLARRLRDRGCGPESRVGVLLERSCELLVALLGILKAGAAYVPLDPEHPADRLAFQERDAGLRLILTRRDLAGRLPGDGSGGLSGEDGRFLFVERGGPPEGDLAGGETRLAVPVDPDCPAYVLYTSGSTGRPKGAVISHRAIVNRLLWMQEALRLTPADRVLQKTPVSFDVSVWELFWPLMTGARLVVARPGGHRDNAYLAHLITGQGITVLHFVPSMLQLFVEEPGAGTCLTLRDVVSSGEALPAGLAQRFAARLGHARLHNLYGPTEAAVDVTFWVCESGDSRDGRGSVPIGRPIANTRIRLLDPGLLPVPAGVPGELYIGGVNLARGYVDRPGLTAERFLPDPAGGAPGERLYRTGDLARWREDGAIEFLGRTDHQVKIRGFRIELGEIEAVLTAHAAVEQAVVDVRGTGAAQRLVAWVTGEESPSLAAGLRAHLQALLPDYMVPTSIGFVEALPLSPNGKVDRRKLPDPGERLTGGHEAAVPRTPLEQYLAGLWRDALDVESVGLHDSFFDLGGNSMTGAVLVNRLQREMGEVIRLIALFVAPTVAEMAAHLEREHREAVRRLWGGEPAAAAAGAALIPRAERREGPLPLSFAQQRLWFLDRLEPGSAAYNIPAAVRFGGPLAPAVLAATLSEVVRRHEVLRTSFHEVENQPAQIVAPPVEIALPVVDLSALPEGRREAEARRHVDAQSWWPFDLERPPLLRASLVRLAEADHIAIFTVHHIVSDGWSTGILVRELGILYRAFQEGKTSPLPELPIQYADFAAWQRHRREPEVLQGLVEHWRRRLSGAPPRLDLPGARPRPAALSPRGAARQRRFSASLLERLEALGRRESTTLFMTLLAPLKALLHAHSGVSDIVVGTDVTGRDRPETEGLIGFFVNQLPLRTDLSGDPTLLDLLRRVRETALAAYAHQELPFDHLVEALLVKRSLRHAPVFQVKLVLQNAGQESLDLPDLTLQMVPLEAGTAQLDLHWSVTEVAGGGLWVRLTFSTDLYDALTVDRLLDQYESWLQAFAERPESRLGEVAAELAEAEGARRADRDLELKSMGLGKLRGMRRQEAPSPLRGTEV